MGLSAAQARLLTITARKSDCEFQSMSLSHQKIALSRDMERISTEYQNSLNNTKLVYDYTGTNTSNMDVSYGLLMTPSVYNDYYPKLVTDAKNRVVLNSSYAAAARAAGIPAEGLTGTPSSDVRNRFIEALAANDIITPATATTIQGTTYGNTIGLGSTKNVTVGTTDCTYDELLTLLKTTESTTTAGVSLGNGATKIHYRDSKDKWKDAYEEVYKDGTKVAGGNKSTDYSLTLADLLENNYDLYYSAIRSEQTPIMETAELQKKIIDQVLPWISDQFTSVMGGVTSNELAIQYAYNQVYDLLYGDGNLGDLAATFNYAGGNGGDTDLDEHTEYKKSRHSDVTGKTYSIKDTMESVGTKVSGDVEDSYYNDVGIYAKDHIGFVYSAANKGSDDDGNDHCCVAISISNIAKVFLTAMVQFQEGADNTDYSYNKGNIARTANLYDPKKDGYTFKVVTNTDADAGTDSSVANFYDALFNKICLNGWTENDMIDDTSYLQEMMKSGMVYLSSISTDGNYYQGSYSTDTHISEVADSEAIAQAEAKYNTEKAKIENKEDTIDLKMKNLDTEISSLTTEYDSTKQIITKSIEKSFKRYDA